ncbi:hypothetical protein QUB75_27045 [Microcoleus sp. K1-B6]|uniref:hypothetical protein n=1 Tax=unclassified Microcoleus TaxID=2642155 RepID=UPI002FCF28BE
MAKRFGDIENAGILKVALDNLNKYRAEAATRPSPQITGDGTPKNRIQSRVSITPFYLGKVTATNMTKNKIIVRASKSSLDATDNFGKATIDDYYDATPATGATDAPEGFTPSRCRTFHPTAANAVYTKSKYTGLYYAKRTGIGYSLPIGRKAFDDTQESVQAAIKTALTAEINTTPYRSVSFTNEKPPTGTSGGKAAVE